MENFNEFDQPVGPEKSTGAIISHAFEIYKGIFLYALAATIIYLLASLIIQPLSGFDTAAMLEEYKSSPTTFSMWSIPGMGLYYGLAIAVGILIAPLFVGVIYVANKQNLNEEKSFGDLFIGYKQNFVNILIYAVVSSVILGISAMLCVIPVFFVFPLLLLGYPILLFENATFSEAISKSFAIAKENYGTFLGAGLLGGLISISGIFLCGIGIVFTMMFYLVTMYSLYCAYCGRPRAIAIK